MGYTHPIGDDHPFRAVYALAQAQGFGPLKIVDVYDGALIRLYTSAPNLCFKLAGDPGSAMDRQRFDYSKHVRIDPGPPEDMLTAIKTHILDTPSAHRSKHAPSTSDPFRLTGKGDTK